jgi:RNA polymerase sigma factor (sigma-70 family)
MTSEQETLVTSNLKLASFIGHKYHYNLPIDEAISVAGLGLCKAAIVYNPELKQPDGKEYKFSSFASKYMIYELIKFNRDNSLISSSRTNKEIYYKAKRLLGSGHTYKELPYLLQINEKKLEEVFMSSKYPEDASEFLANNLLIDNSIPSPEDLLFQNDFQEFMKILTKKEQEIIELRKTHSQIEIANLLGQSQTHISRIIRKIEKKFNCWDNNKDLPKEMEDNKKGENNENNK